MQHWLLGMILMLCCFVPEYNYAQIPFDEVVRTSAIVVKAAPITIEHYGNSVRALMEVSTCYKGKEHIAFPFTIWVEWSLNADEQYMNQMGKTCILCLSGQKTDSVYHLSACRYWQAVFIFPSAVVAGRADGKSDISPEYRDSLMRSLMEAIPAGQDSLIAAIRDVCPSSIQWPVEVMQLEIENKPSYYYRKKRYTVLPLEQLLAYIEKITGEEK